MEKSTPVISGEVASKRWYQRRNVLIDIAVIVAVLIIITVIWWIGHRPKPAEPSNVPQYTGQALVDEVNKKYGQHDFVGAIKLVQGQKTISETSTQLLLAAAYFNAGDNQKSLDVYEKLEKQKPLSENDCVNAANAATRLNQKQKAIAYFEKAKQRANPKDVDQLEVYDYQIKELQK